MSDEVLQDSPRSGPTKKQRLYPGAIFAVSREFEDWKERTKQLKGDPVVIPTLFSKLSRTFHWLAVHPHHWWMLGADGAKNGLVVEVIVQELRELAKTERWQVFCENLETSNRISLDRAIKYFRQFVCSEEFDYLKRLEEGQTGPSASTGPPVTPDPKRPPNKEYKDSDADEFIRHLLTLYEGYHHSPLNYWDGVIHRTLLELHANKKDRHIGIGSLSAKQHWVNGTYERYPWVVDCTFRGLGGVKDVLARDECQKCQSQEDSVAASCDEIVDIPSDKQTQNANKPNDDAIDIQDFLLQTIVGKPKEKWPGSIVLVPIYDAVVNDQPCGALWGSVNFLFEENSSPKKGRVKAAIKAAQGFQQSMIGELRKFAISSVLSEPFIAPYDFVEHFVRHIPTLQDWEQIIVYRLVGDDDKRSDYCYRWGDSDKKSGFYPKWDRPESCPELCELPKNHGPDEYLDCEPGEIWNEANIPNITEDEKYRLGDIGFLFKYPKTSIVPDDPEHRHTLGDIYKRQILDVMRGLLRKVRARRAALSNAAVSIMSRNMSHNIGSHVLAALQRTGAVHEPSEVANLFSHLQARMDFIAELSTTTPSLTMPTSIKDDIVASFDKQKLLRKYITARRQEEGGGERPAEVTGDANSNEVETELPVNVTIEYCGKKDNPKIPVKVRVTNSEVQGDEKFSVEANGDENSENDKKELPVKVSVEYCGNEESANLPIEVKVDLGGDEVGTELLVQATVEYVGKTDPIFECVGGLAGYQALSTIFENIVRNVAKHTKELKHGGANISLYVRCEPSVQPYGDYVKLEIWDRQGTALEPIDKDSDTSLKTWYQIDKQYRAPRILAESGTLEDGHWGLKEIYLCAAYLRGVPLVELESRRQEGPKRLVEVYPADDDGNEIHPLSSNSRLNLGYRFYLPIAKTLAIILDSTSSILNDKKLVEDARNHGIGVYSRFGLKKSLPHPLVIWSVSDDSAVGPDDSELGRMSPRWISVTPLPENWRKNLQDGRFADLILSVRTAFMNNDNTKTGHERIASGRSRLIGVNYGDLAGVEPDWVGEADMASGTELSNIMEKQVSIDLEDDEKAELGKWVMHDYHGTIVRRDAFPHEGFDDVEGRFLDFLCYGGAYEAFPSISPQSHLLGSWVCELGDPKLFQHEIFRALYQAVLVLDERVQEQVCGGRRNSAAHPYSNLFTRGLKNMPQCMQDGKRSFEFQALLASANVWVPSSDDIDLNHPHKKFENFVKKLENNEVEVSASRRRLAIDQISYVVVHQGVIDRLRRDGDNEPLEKFLTGTLKDKTLIVCSGRGRPGELSHVHKLRKDVRFVSVSAILEYIVRRPSKLNLVTTLESSRCPYENRSVR